VHHRILKDACNRELIFVLIEKLLWKPLMAYKRHRFDNNIFLTDNLIFWLMFLISYKLHMQ